MIDKLIIDGNNIELTEKDKMPYTYAFSTAKVHTVKYALSDTDEISAGAFANCSYMTKVKFPPEIKMIKRRAFENCVRLNNVVIPKTIEYIGANVWNGCTSMTEMTFEATTPPSNSSAIPAGCKVYIPNDSKYVEVTGKLDPDTTQYYSKTEYNMFNAVPANMLEDGKTYYKDNWTTIAPNDVTIEEKNRIPIEDIEVESTNITVNVKTENGENVILPIEYKIMPENATNRKLYFISSNPNGFVKILDDTKEGELLLECTYNQVSFTDINIYAESGVNVKLTINTTVR